MEWYLAVDIGASSGRHILGHLEDGKMVLEEVYRFFNGMKQKNGTLTWDVDGLFEEILAGMKKCRDLGKTPKSVGIDTWAVDFVLLDNENRRIGDAAAYRDSRTRGMDAEVGKIISPEELYGRTGIQKQDFNTIYQLMALKKQNPELLKQAESLLMIPDYFHFLLSGKKSAEYTNATTTQLVDAVSGNWDFDLIHKLGYPEKIFQPIMEPGTVLGELREEIKEKVGYNCQVVIPATHDTACAVMAVPSQEENTLYISSGTWSLMGTERRAADCSEESRLCNFTNEGGYENRFRYLKNIMGLWMIQSVRKELAPEESFGAICEAAEKTDIPSLVDCNDSRFLAPENMTKEVQKACKESGQPVPEGIAQVAAVIYKSLAVCYKNTLKELEERSGSRYGGIHIVGGGSDAEYLNRLTAKACGIPVYAGPKEATAVGNLSAQMIAGGALLSLQGARSCIYRSFPIKKYESKGEGEK